MQMDIGKDLIQKYLIRRQEDLVQLRRAVGDGDLETLKRISHQIKGNGETFGFPELGEAASRIETAAFQEDPLEIQKAVAEFELELGTTLERA